MTQFLVVLVQLFCQRVPVLVGRLVILHYWLVQVHKDLVVMSKWLLDQVHKHKEVLSPLLRVQVTAMLVVMLL